MRVDPIETKVFDPADGFAPLTDVVEATDPSVFRRGDRWWMAVATEVANRPGVQLATASLPKAAPLSASGWRLPADSRDPTKIATLPQERSRAWDLRGGRHCPSYATGVDPQTGLWVERIYYAGAVDHVWGPYTIGYLEWDGERWIDQPEPVFVATEPWERGSVFEPNVIFADGKWKLWYAAGSHQENYHVHGCAESEDGRSRWTTHQIFAPPEMKMFDFHVRRAGEGYEGVFSRVCLQGTAPAETGLWWCRADQPSSRLSDWSEPVQFMTAADRGCTAVRGNHQRRPARVMRTRCSYFSAASTRPSTHARSFRSCLRWAVPNSGVPKRCKRRLHAANGEALRTQLSGTSF